MVEKIARIRNPAGFSRLRLLSAVIYRRAAAVRTDVSDWMINMGTTNSKSLSYYLELEYPFIVVAHPDGDYVVSFPDLPGCMTQVESLADISPMAEEIRTLWIETAYDHGIAILPPSYPEE